MQTNCQTGSKSASKTKHPCWYEADQKANKKGVHHTVFFVTGDQYVGDWDKNIKNGRGTMQWTSKGLMYEGDWKDDMKNGFGVLSVKIGKDSHKKVYSGGWKANKRHGFGENWYSETEFYEGEWYEDMRSGWGRMYFADGTIYEGEWDLDEMSGNGMLKSKNGNRYEGAWKNGKRNGIGKYYYLNKGQILEGVWVDNVAKCGKMSDIDRDTATDATEFPIRTIELANPVQVIKDAESYFLSQIP